MCDIEKIVYITMHVKISLSQIQMYFWFITDVWGEKTAIMRLISLLCTCNPGLEAGVEVGQKRLFMSHGGCRDGLTLKQGSQYLIIGPREDLWTTDSNTNK